MINDSQRRAGTKTATPPIVAGARFFLVVGIVSWSLGVFAAVVDAWGELSAGLPNVVPVVALLIWQSTLLAIAILALWATQRRKASGRWLTVALAMFAGYLSILRVARLWNASAHGDYRSLKDYFAYNSQDELNTALVLAVLVVAALAVLVRQLLVGRNAIEYFEQKPEQPTGNAA